MIKIVKPTSKQTVAAIKSGDFYKIDKIKAAAKKDAKKVFNAVSLIWYDLPPVQCQSGAVSVMRYALHRSPKKAALFLVPCILFGWCWFVTCAGLFPVVPFICLFNGLYLHHGIFYHLRL